MTNAYKGALLSGLVLPGLGQFVLKRRKRGIVLMLAVLAGVSIIAAEAVRQAWAIVDTIKSAGGAIDMGAISAAAARASAAAASPLLEIVQLLVVACWIFSIVDAYAIGKKMDAGRASNSGGSPGA